MATSGSLLPRFPIAGLVALNDMPANFPAIAAAPQLAGIANGLPANAAHVPD